MKVCFAEEHGCRKKCIHYQNLHKSQVNNDHWQKKEIEEGRGKWNAFVTTSFYTTSNRLRCINRRRIPHSVIVSTILKANAYVNHFVLFAPNMIILPLPKSHGVQLGIHNQNVYICMYLYRPCVKIKRKNILLEKKKSLHCVLVSCHQKTKVFSCLEFT